MTDIVGQKGKQMKVSVKLGLLAVATLAATPAHAEWLKASSRHFRIYSNTTPENIKRLATRLEQVDGGLRLIAGLPDKPESAANPVTVYFVDTTDDIQALVRSDNVAGFYIGRASGAVAFTPRLSSGSGINPQVVLFHEYAHHWLLASSNIAFPAWLSEGFAEFAATARFNDSAVIIGAPAQHREYGLRHPDKLAIRILMGPRQRLDGLQTEQLYGRGWLLTHYLIFGRQRPREQISKYLGLLNNGVAPLDAATTAFGDLRLLDKEMDSYLARDNINAATIPISRLPAITIDVRPLTGGERALIQMRMVSDRGVNAQTAGPLYARAAAAAAPFANDAVAQGWLGEMAYDAGNNAEAEAAADRALAANPRSMHAMLYKGLVLQRRAKAAAKRAGDPAWGQARAWFLKAHQLDTNVAYPLVLFYDSFGEAGETPSANAVDGLYRAHELAPQDDGLRFQAARQLLVEADVPAARRLLRPLAFEAHAVPDNPASRLLAMLDGGTTGPAAIAALDAERKKAGAKGK